MSDDDTIINFLVLSAETDFQLKLLNTNLQDIAKELNKLNNNVAESSTTTNKNLNELISFLYNFTLNVSVTNADIKKLNKNIESIRDNLNPLVISK